MITIHYKILRYQPDRVTGEFVNLGIAAFDTSTGFLNAKFISKIGRIACFFNQTNSAYLISMVQSIKVGFELHADKFNLQPTFPDEKRFDGIVNSILPKDDSALYFTDTKKGLYADLDSFTEYMFERLVKDHQSEEDDDEREIKNDKEVWNKIYKKHFDENGISNHLSSHKVKTKHDELEFEKAWKNGVWNCFEAVSFNLTRPDAIKNKVYNWAGKLDELSSTKEPLHIYLLSNFSPEHPELNKFIQHKLKEKSSDNLKIELVSEKNVENVLKKIKKEMEEHS